MQNDHDDGDGRDILLKLQVPVDGDEGIEPVTTHAGEKASIAPTLPAQVDDVRDVKPGQLTLEPMRRAFVKQDAHLFCRGFGDEERVAELERGHGLFARHGRKVFEKLVE